MPSPFCLLLEHKVLLEHNHVRLSLCPPWLLLCCGNRAEQSPGGQSPPSLENACYLANWSGQERSERCVNHSPFGLLYRRLGNLHIQSKFISHIPGSWAVQGTSGFHVWWGNFLVTVFLGRRGKEASLRSPLWSLIPAPEFHDDLDLISEKYCLLLPPL